MFKKFAVIAVLVFGMAVFYGCSKSPVASTTGTTATPTTGTPTTGTSTIKITGTVTVSDADLAKLGMSKSTSSISSMSTGIGALAAASNSLLPTGTAYLYSRDASGKEVQIPDMTVAVKDGKYEFPNVPGQYAGKPVMVKILAANKGNMLECRASITADNSEVSANVDPISTLAAELIDNLIETLGSNNFTADALKKAKENFVATITKKIEEGKLIIPSFVRKETEKENVGVNDTVQDIRSDDAIKNGDKLMELDNEKEKARKDIEIAKLYIEHVFNIIVGQANGIPLDVIDALAKAFVDDKKFSIKEIMDAVNKAGSINLDASQIVLKLNTRIANAHKAISTANDAMILAIFPKERVLTTDEKLDISELMFVIDSIMKENYSVNPLKLLKELGIYELKMGIVSADIKIVSYYDPISNKESKALMTYVALYDPRGKSYLDNAKVELTYPTEAGSATVSLKAVTNFMSGPTIGAPTGGSTTMKKQQITPKSSMPTGPGTEMMSEMKMFEINPWGIGPTSPGTVISDFKKADAQEYKITAVVSDTNLEKKIIVEYVNISPQIIFTVPKPGEEAEIILGSEPPKFLWEVGGDAIPAGYTLKFAIDLFSETYGYSLYSTWYNNEHITDNYFIVPSAVILQAGEKYKIMVTPVVIKNANGELMPAGSGASATFKIKSSSDLISENYTLRGELKNFPATVNSLKAGIFKSPYTYPPTRKLVAKATIDSNNITFNIATKDLMDPDNIEIVAWEDANNNDLFESGSFDPKSGKYTEGEKTVYCEKSIMYDRGMLVTYAMDSNGYFKQYPLKDSLTGFDFTYYSIPSMPTALKR